MRVFCVSSSAVEMEVNKRIANKGRQMKRKWWWRRSKEYEAKRKSNKQRKEQLFLMASRIVWRVLFLFVHQLCKPNKSHRIINPHSGHYHPTLPKKKNIHTHALRFPRTIRCPVKSAFHNVVFACDWNFVRFSACIIRTYKDICISVCVRVYTLV